jgi:putative spermidine/putrescine transport system ATP-binding protein
LHEQDVVLVRPEDVDIGEQQAGWSRGVIQQRVFLGDRVQFRVRLPGDDVLLVDASRDSEFQVGQPVGVSVNPSRFMPSKEVNA